MSELGVGQNTEPKIVVTNTIIVGIKYEGGIMIASDISPIGGAPISNIHRLHDNIYAAVTGVGQDTCALVNVIRSKLQMHYMTTNYRRVPVRCANQMTKKLLHSQCGSLNVNVLIGGVDKYGTAMYSTRFDGSSDTVPFTAIGSGMFSAMTVLETRWRICLDEATARDVIYEAVVFGTHKLVSSQSPVRLCILKTDYSVVLETLGSYVQAPRPPILRFVPKAVQKRVDNQLESCAAEGRRDGSEEEQEKMEEINKKQMD